MHERGRVVKVSNYTKVVLSYLIAGLHFLILCVLFVVTQAIWETGELFGVPLALLVIGFTAFRMRDCWNKARRRHRVYRGLPPEGPSPDSALPTPEIARRVLRTLAIPAYLTLVAILVFDVGMALWAFWEYPLWGPQGYHGLIGIGVAVWSARGVQWAHGQIKRLRAIK